jgi:hypothetical protein
LVREVGKEARPGRECPVALHLSLLPPNLGKQSVRFGLFPELARNTALLLGCLLAVLREPALLLRMLLPLLRGLALFFGLLTFVLGKLPLAGGAITLRERGHFGLLGCLLGGAGLEILPGGDGRHDRKQRGCRGGEPLPFRGT